MIQTILLLMAAVAMMTAMNVQAQNQPAGMRVEVAESETDNGEYSILTYKDSEADDSFGYYLSLGRVADSNFKIDIKLHPKQHRKQ